MATIAFREIWKEWGPGNVGDMTLDILERALGATGESPDDDRRLITSLAVFLHPELRMGEVGMRQSLAITLCSRAMCDPADHSGARSQIGKLLAYVTKLEYRKPGGAVGLLVDLYNRVHEIPIDSADIRADVEVRFAKMGQEEILPGGVGRLMELLLWDEMEGSSSPEMNPA